MFNNGILFSDVLILKLLNNPSASCSFIHLDFLLPETTHFDDKANLPFLVYIIFASLLFASLLHFKQYVSMFVLYYLLTTFLLCFCFINLDLSEKHSAHLKLSLKITLFVIVIFFESILPVCSLQAKQ